MQSLFSFIRISIDAIQDKASIALKKVSRIMSEVESHEFALIKLGQANKIVIPKDMAAKVKAEISVNKNLQEDVPDNRIFAVELIAGLQVSQ